MHTIEEVKAEVDRLNEIIKAPSSLLPTFGLRREAWPSIEVDRNAYHYVVSERGQETRFTTDNLDDLLCKVFSSIVFMLAYRDYQANSVADQDSRRVMFDFQIRTLTLLSPEWGARKKREFDDILLSRPFDDAKDVRNRLIKSLQDKGSTYEEADHRASRQYPRP